MIVLILVLAVLLFFFGLFSASETALFSLSSLKVKTYKQDKDPRKQLIAQLLSSPRQLLVTIIMLNVSFNILVQNVTSSICRSTAHGGQHIEQKPNGPRSIFTQTQKSTRPCQSNHRSYNMIKNKMSYKEAGVDYHDKLHKERAVKKLRRFAEKLGYAVTPRAQPETACYNS
jgi:hypothetical protein